MRIAVIGCGYWGKNLVRNVNELGALAAVVEPGEAGAKQAAVLAPKVPVVADLNKVLNDNSISAVMISTPAETHFDVARRAIEHGKDVFVEKPMTVNVSQARALVGFAREHDRLLMVGHLLEYHPAIRKIYELAHSGALGKLYYVVSNRLNLGKIRTEENALWSFAPHDIAVTLRLIGQLPDQVVATGGCYVQSHLADVTTTQLRFANGVRAHIFVSWLHPFKEQRLTVIGSQRMASYDDTTKELVLYNQRVEWTNGQPVPIKGHGEKIEFDPAEPLKLECEHFLHCVKTRQQPRTDGVSGLNVISVLEAAQASLQQDGCPVSCGGE